MEIWDVYDENRTKTGRTVSRGEMLAPGERHLAVHVCLFNRRGEMLIQRRHPDKPLWPGAWDLSAGGAAVAGDDSRSAAEREAFEELGLRLDLSGVRPALTVNLENCFNDIYLIEREVDIAALTLQPEEVVAVRWASQQEICRMIDAGTFVAFHKGFIAALFDMRKNGDAKQR